MEVLRLGERIKVGSTSRVFPAALKLKHFEHDLETFFFFFRIWMRFRTSHFTPGVIYYMFFVVG